MGFKDIFERFFIKPKVTITQQFGDKQVLKIDTVPSESHNASNIFTDLPVENGASISDHSIKGPRKLELNGIITDTPVGLFENIVGTVTGFAAGFVGGLVTTGSDNAKLGGGSVFKNIGVGTATTFGVAKLSNTLLGLGKTKRSLTAYQLLSQIRAEGGLVEVVTGLTTYTNMGIEDFSVNRTANTAGGLFFTISLKEILFVKSKQVQVPIENTADGNQNLENQGKKDAETVDASKESEIRPSALYLGFKKLGFIPDTQ